MIEKLIGGCRMKNLTIIKCPKCGMEYLPAELFVPAAFFGTPDIIKRDTEGHIIDYLGSGLDTKELYTCDSCNTAFNIECSISFNTTVNEEANFQEEYVTPVSKARFTIDEF